MNFNNPISYFPAKITEKVVFSILIPSWNNLEFLKICVNSILKNSTYKHQIIIHINQGIDGTIDYVKKMNIGYTKSNHNVGVCYAMNAMAKLVKTNYILYLNDDMYVCPKWDFFLFEAIKSNKNDKFYFSSTLIEPKNSNNKCVISPYNFGYSKDDFDENGLISFVSKKNNIKKDWFGATWPPSVMHVKLWNQIGGYSTEFSPGFGSDPDVSMKLWNAGVRNFLGIGKSMVYHFQSKSTGRVVKNNGRIDFMKKWGFPSSFFYKQVLRLGAPVDSVPLTFNFNFNYKLARIKTKLILM